MFLQVCDFCIFLKQPCWNERQVVVGQIPDEKREKKRQWNLFNSMLYVPNSNLPRLRFFVYCIFITMWHSHLNDMEIRGATSFIPMGLNWVHHGVS